MSYPASATEPGQQLRLSELMAAGSLEISPRELHQSAAVAALLPAGTCAYIPSLPGLPLARMLEIVAAMRKAGLDPAPHIAARRIRDRDELREFLKKASAEHGVHRVLVIGGDEPKAQGPYADSVEFLEAGMLAECNIREIGVAGYPEGHPAISPAVLESALQRKISLAREQKLGLYTVTQFSFSPARIIDYCSNLARTAPGVSVYVGIAGPTDPIALARYAQRCGVSASLRALRKLGSGIAKLVTHTDPREHVMAVARYSMSREPSNVAGMHLYSFGGAVRTATWMREIIAGR